MFGISEIAILIIVAILVLGAKKLPELSRSAGKSMRILKSEAKAMKHDDRPTDDRPAYRVTADPTPGKTPPAPSSDSHTDTPRG